MPARQRVSDEQCIAAYERFGHLGQAAASIGIQKSSFHERLIRLGISTAKARAWSAIEDDRLRADYRRYREAGKVKDLAMEMDRTISAMCSRAYSLKLTDPMKREDVVEREHFRRSRDDRDRAMMMLLSAGASDHELQCFVLDGDPMSKARARFSRRGNAFTPASVRAAEDRWIERLAGSRKYTGNVAVSCIFVRATNQRIDVDNMVKLVLDACTKAEVWEDDSQVTAIIAVEEFDGYEPRTIVALGHHKSTMKRGTDHWPNCQACGAKVNPKGRKNAKFCNRDCQSKRPIPNVAR